MKSSLNLLLKTIKEIRTKTGKYGIITDLSTKRIQLINLSISPIETGNSLKTSLQISSK